MKTGSKMLMFAMLAAVMAWCAPKTQAQVSAPMAGQPVALGLAPAVEQGMVAEQDAVGSDYDNYVYYYNLSMEFYGLYQSYGGYLNLAYAYYYYGYSQYYYYLYYYGDDDLATAYFHYYLAYTYYYYDLYMGEVNGEKDGGLGHANADFNYHLAYTYYYYAVYIYRYYVNAGDESSAAYYYNLYMDYARYYYNLWYQSGYN